MFLLRITVFIIFSLIFFAQSALCADYRVKDIILDNSDKMVIIQGQGNFKSPNPSSYIPIPTANNSINLITDITTFTITAPTRYVIDIPNASLIGGGRNYKMNNSSILQNIQLGQFSSNPDIVRIVFTLKKAGDLNKFKTYTNGKDIIVKYGNSLVENSLQYKFYTPNGDMDKKANLQNNSASLTYNNNPNEIIDRTPSFQTRYHLNQISQNSDGLILRGIGQISLQKASYTPDNTRATLILDNTSTTSKIDGKSYNVPSSQKDIDATLTINRINSKKVKLTLDGNTIRDYRFVVSPDGQSLFVSHRSYIINTVFSSNTANINSYKFSQTEAGYKLFDMVFDKSVAYNVFELNNNFYIDINNLGDYNIPLFEQAFKDSGINIQALKISTDKTRFIIPMENLNFAYANVESNAKSIKICFKEKPVQIEQPIQGEIIIATNIQTEKNGKTEKPTQTEEKKTENINVIYVPKNENPEKIEKPKKKKENSTISSMKKVVIDPGHGGADSGAIGGGIFEKDINLKVSKLVQEKLMKKDIYVYMTRTKDSTLTLEDRVNYSNELNPDIFVSIHTNSTVKEDSYGLETHYFKDDSFELAEIIHKNFASNKNLRKWDTLDRGMIKSRFYVINHTEAPSVLMEIGFISNLEERSKLITDDRQEEIANAIAKGILEYLKIK